MMRHLLCWLLLVLVIPAGAEELRLSGQERAVPLAAYAMAYEDKTAVQDIKTVVQQSFAPWTPALQHPGYTKSAIWLRLDVANTSTEPLTRWLDVQSTRLQEVSLFIWQQGRWQRLDAGASQPVAQRPIAATSALFQLKLAAGSHTTAYLRVASQTTVAINPTLWEPLAYREETAQVSLFDGLLLGSLALAGIAGLLMFAMLRDRAFLLQTTTTLSYFMHEASARGYSAIYLWPDAMEWTTRSIGFFGTFSTCALLMFVRDLLATRVRLPRWDRILLALAAIQVFILVGQLFGDYQVWARTGALFSALVLPICIVVTTLLAVRLNFPTTRFYVAAFVAGLLGNLVSGMVIFGWIAPTRFTAYALPLGALLTNTLLLAAVVDRVLLVRKEKEAAQRALLETRAAHEAQLELAVEQRTADLNTALAETRIASQTKSRLLAYVSHDLRTPLATIVNCVHRLNWNADSKTREYHSTIEHCAMHQLELIDDLVEYARGELDRLELLPIPTYLYAWLDDIGKQAELLAEQYGNRFALETSGELPAVAVFDPKRLRQVLLNLLSNAAKFTADGNIRLCVHGESVADGRYALDFVVEDTGPGIPQNDRERVFLPFERRNEAREGFGLGLSIARQIVRGMGDELKLDSAPELGSRFSFRLVLASANESDVVPLAPPVVASAHFGAGKSALVVDDNPVYREMLQEMLSLADFDVMCAANGTDAWRLAGERRFDIILVDQYMPGMGGWQLLRALHARFAGASPPVILCSAMPPQPPENFPADVTFSLTLLKPVTAAKLLQAVQQVLEPPAEASPSSVPMDIPAALLERLRALVDLGDITGIASWAVTLENEYPQHAECARRIADAARRIALDELSAFVSALGIATQTS